MISNGKKEIIRDYTNQIYICYYESGRLKILEEFEYTRAKDLLKGKRLSFSRLEFPRLSLIMNLFARFAKSILILQKDRQADGSLKTGK